MIAFNRCLPVYFRFVSIVPNKCNIYINEYTNQRLPFFCFVLKYFITVFHIFPHRLIATNKTYVTKIILVKTSTKTICSILTYITKIFDCNDSNKVKKEKKMLLCYIFISNNTLASGEELAKHHKLHRIFQQDVPELISINRIYSRS